MIVVRQKNPGTAEEAGLVECIQYCIDEIGKCLWCLEDVAVFVASCSDQVFASDIAKCGGA